MPSDFDPDEMVQRGIPFLGAKKDRKTGHYVGRRILGRKTEEDS